MKKKISNKTFLFLGVLFLLISFGCIIGVLYQLFDANQRTNEDADAMEEELDSLFQQKISAEKRAQQLAQRVGKEIELDRLVAVAQQEYGEAEGARKEGDLWIDPQGESWMVTLGALNGIENGSRLSVFDGDKKIGVVVAESVLDVVSYVRPLEDAGKYQQSIYRVAVE